MNLGFFRVRSAKGGVFMLGFDVRLGGQGVSLRVIARSGGGNEAIPCGNLCIKEARVSHPVIARNKQRKSGGRRSNLLWHLRVIKARVFIPVIARSGRGLERGATKQSPAAIFASLEARVSHPVIARSKQRKSGGRRSNLLWQSSHHWKPGSPIASLRGASRGKAGGDEAISYGNLRYRLFRISYLWNEEE
jgi:hypothetical protein